MAENATESMKDYEKELERSFRTINEGDIVSGTVIAVSEEDVTLDLNYYTQGIIKTENLSNDPDFNPKEQLQMETATLNFQRKKQMMCWHGISWQK